MREGGFTVDAGTFFRVRNAAAAATVAAIDEHLSALLVYTDLLSSGTGANDATTSELRSSLMASITAVRVLKHELAMIVVMFERLVEQPRSFP